MRLFWKIFITAFVLFAVVISITVYTISSTLISASQRRIVDENSTVGSLISKQIRLGSLESMWPFESLNQLSGRRDFLFWWVVRDDGTIHLADKGSFMRTSATDYFPQLANTRAGRDVYLDHKQGYGISINPLETGGKHWSFWLGFSMRDISEIRKRIIALGIITSVLALAALGAILTFAIRRFIRPIKDLSAGTAAIAEGNLDHRVKVTSGDELAQLAQSFNDMTEELQRTTVSKGYVDNIIASMIDALVVADSQSRINTVNRATCEMLGYGEGELIGEPVEIIFADDVPLSGEQLEELIRKGELRNYETSWKTKYGKEIPVLFAASATKDEQGDVISIVCTARDITDRKRAEQALRESEERYRTLVQNVPVAVYRTTPGAKGRFLMANPAFLKMFGLESEEELGKITVADVYMNPGDRKAFSDKLVAEGSVSDVEVQLRKKDGSPIWASVTARVTQDESAKNPYFDCTLMDITDRKRAEEEKEKLEAQLRQAHKVEAIGTLAGGIAHNFNNLLMAIMGNTSLMLLDTDPIDPNYERLKSIEKSVHSGSKLTQQLLGYAREGRYEIKPLNLNQLVKETSHAFAMTKKEIRVHRELARDLLGIEADQGQIEQVLLNLYVNASDAMPGGGDLFLKTANVTDRDMRGMHCRVRPGKYVLLTVRDTGTGMDKETMERIFDPFFTTKGMGRGTGLGLASVYGIIKGHGGYIDVDSQRGHGTTFSIYLPASEKEAVEENETQAELVRGKGTVLLVDDEDMILDVGEKMLEAVGYEVLLARGGKEAIELYRGNKDKIDIVILDMIMPDMGGGETYERMKGMDPDVKVLLSSGYSIDGQAKEILERGCDGFIQKPFSIEDLSRRAREILDKRD